MRFCMHYCWSHPCYIWLGEVRPHFERKFDFLLMHGGVFWALFWENMLSLSGVILTEEDVLWEIPWHLLHLFSSKLRPIFIRVLFLGRGTLIELSLVLERANSLSWVGVLQLEAILGRVSSYFLHYHEIWARYDCLFRDSEFLLHLFQISRSTMSGLVHEGGSQT